MDAFVQSNMQGICINVLQLGWINKVATGVQVGYTVAGEGKFVCL
jgi:hypothetical protein